MLANITVSRFKALKQCSESLDRLNVLIGTNNCGKSSFLQGIHCAVGLAQSRLQLPDQNRMLFEATKFTIAPTDVFYLPGRDATALALDGRLTQRSGPTITMTFPGDPAPTGTVEIRLGKNKNLVVRLRGQAVMSRLEKLEQPFSIYVPGLAGIAKAERLVGYGELVRAIARGDANLFLRNVLNVLQKDPAKWKEFGSALSEVFPDNIVFVDYNEASDEFIDVFVKRGESYIPLDSTGTGFLQTTQILSYRCLFQPAVMLVDEPDSHLHPNNQRAIADLLWKLSVSGQTQIIMATHSRHILDSLRERDGVKFIWIRNGSSQPVTDHFDILTDLGALDSAEGLLSKGIQFVVLTEDKKKKMFKVLLSSLGIAETRYQIWSYRGCSRQDVAHALAGFIQEVSPATEIIVHRDFDYLDPDDEARLKQTYQDLGLKLFLTPGVDVEGVFCRLAHLKSLNADQTKVIDEIYLKALTTCAPEFKEKAKKGAEEIDNLRHKSGIPTKGKEAISNWVGSLDVSTERWIHGKIFLAKLRELFQEATKTNLNIEAPSPSLKLRSLEALLPRPTPPKPSPPADAMVVTATPVVVEAAVAPPIIPAS
jgi:hypothetical protein